MRRSLLPLALICASFVVPAASASAYTDSGEPIAVSNPYNAAANRSEQPYVDYGHTKQCARPYGSSSVTCISVPAPEDSTSCGPGTWGDALVPDGGPWFSFTSACSWHDSCYGAKVNSRRYCDDGFYDRTLYSCQVSYSNSTSCRNTAYLYYKAVYYFGWLAY